VSFAIRKASDGSMLVAREPLPAIRPDLQKVIEANQ
jgi:hypothetical protein